MRTKVELRVGVVEPAAPTFVVQPNPVPVDFQAGVAGEKTIYYSVESSAPTAVSARCDSPLPPGVTAVGWDDHAIFSYDGRDNPPQAVEVYLVAETTEGKH